MTTEIVGIMYWQKIEAIIYLLTVGNGLTV